MTGKRRAGPPNRKKEPEYAASGPVIAPRQTRRELRAERKARRRKMGAAGVAGLVAVGLIVLAAIGFGVQKATSGGGDSKDLQTSALISLEQPDGAAIASMLAAHDLKAKQGLELLVPPRLIVDVCGYGTQQFGQITTLPGGATIAQRALSQVLNGATVDFTWALSTAEFARLIDAVGGITVDVDVDVTQPGRGGTTVVVVQAGKSQHLTGAQAVEFASFLGKGEDQTAVLSRFQAVMQAVINTLPPSKAVALLTRAGVHATKSVSTLAGLLVALAHDEQASALLPIDLPTKPIDTGSGPPSYRVDPATLDNLVRQRLAPSLPSASLNKHKTVLIYNGAGPSGLVESACNRLLPAGYGFAGSGNAANFNYAKSQIIVYDTGVAGAKLGDDIARRLRLPYSDVVASTQGQNVADVIVILGRDYRR